MTYPQPDQPPHDRYAVQQAQRQPHYPQPQPYAQMQQPWGPPVPPATPARRKVWPWVVGGIVVLIVLGGIGNASKSSSSIASATPSGPSDLATSPASSLPSSVLVAPAPAPAPAGPLTTFGNGTWQVGEDIAPGTYKSPAPQESGLKLCYFDVKDARGNFVDQGVAPEGPSRATLKAGQTFTSKGCEDWVKVG